MSKLVFISGDFSSGSTLLWTLFRKTGQYHCLYEPLHEKLLQYLIYPLRAYEHHFFADNYFSEYKDFKEIRNLFNPEWGERNFYLSSIQDEDRLYKYLKYIIDMSFQRSGKAVLKFNRATFRLGWLKSKFPEAKIVHIYRDPGKQWNSIVRRSQAHHGRIDVGQNGVNFNGMSMAIWCDDLQQRYPALHAANSDNGYERFRKLYNLSYAEHLKYADISVKYEDLVSDFEPVCGQLWQCVGCDSDIEALKKYVIHPGKQKPLTSSHKLKSRLLKTIDMAGHKAARIILRLRKLPH